MYHSNLQVLRLQVMRLRPQHPHQQQRVKVSLSCLLANKADDVWLVEGGSSWKHRRRSTRMMQSITFESKIELAEVDNRREDLDLDEDMMSSTTIDDKPTLIDPATLDNVLASIKHSSIRSQDIKRFSYDSDMGDLNRRSLDEMQGIHYR
jgi:hypothetical protein